LLRLADSDESDLMFKGRIRIDGDTESGHRFKQLLATVNIDWEEQLSQYSGDVIAHQLGRFLRHGKEWLQDSRQRLDRNLSEYLQEEIKLLPQQEEVDQFMSDVDALRADTDRLLARFERLQKEQTTQDERE
jgi:ubiquinone biosynthesis protein UbiJ